MPTGSVVTMRLEADRAAMDVSIGPGMRIEGYMSGLGGAWAAAGPAGQLAARAASPLTPTTPWSLRRLWQVASSSHSPRAWSSPRNSRCLAFCSVLI